MGIVASHNIIKNRPQADGNRYVRFEFVFDNAEIFRDSLRNIPQSWGIDVFAQGLYSVIESVSASQEIERWERDDDNPALDFKFSSKAQAANFIRDKYKKSEGLETLRIANKIQNYILSNDFTNTQLKNVFSLDDTQLATLKIKILDQSTQYQTLLAEVGS